MVLVVVAAILIPLAATALWATRTVLNTDRFTALTTDVTNDPAIISVMAERVTDNVFQAVNGAAVLDQIPPALEPALPIVVGALRSRVQGRVEQLLSSEAGQSVIAASVRQAHAAAMQLLQGDGLLSNDAFTVANGTVTLDLRSVIYQVLVGLQQDGVIPASVAIPAPGDPPGRVATALGSRLPPDFGQVVVYRTQNATGDDVLDSAQHALVTLKRGVVLFVVLGMVSAAAAIVVAVNRRRAVFRVGLGVAIATVLLIVFVRRAAAAVPNAAASPGGKAVAGALADSLQSSLLRALTVLAIVAVVAAIVARWWEPLLREAGTHAEVAQAAAVVLGLLILLVLGWSWVSLILAAVIIALGVVGSRSARRSQLISAGHPVT
jgi:hypothetical protein